MLSLSMRMKMTCLLGSSGGGDGGEAAASNRGSGNEEMESKAFAGTGCKLN